MYNHERYILFKSSMIIAQGSIELSQEKINFCRFIFDFELKNYEIEFESLIHCIMVYLNLLKS
jgi:hypothetical protein